MKWRGEQVKNPPINTIITNADLDAIISASLLTEQLGLDPMTIRFVHPAEAQQGRVSATSKTVVANLPYVPDAALWFDHHKSNINLHTDIPGKRVVAPSCARVIANYFEVPDSQILQETDRIDSGCLTPGDLLHPEGFMLLSYTIHSNVNDPEEVQYNRELVRRVSNCHGDLSCLTEYPEVQKRIKSYRENLKKVSDFIQPRTRREHNVIIVDLRDADDPVYIDGAYKFVHYGMYPEADVSIRLYYPDLDQERTRLQVGWSVLNKSCTTDISATLAPLGGGGHRAAGGVTVDSGQAEGTFNHILTELLEK